MLYELDFAIENYQYQDTGNFEEYKENIIKQIKCADVYIIFQGVLDSYIEYFEASSSEDWDDRFEDFLSFCDTNNITVSL